MKTPPGTCWRVWIPALLAVPICVVVLQAWLAPGIVASWVMILSFCG